jgi:O-antigen/teichoic acid export membrane protein
VLPPGKPRPSLRFTLARNTVSGWLGHAINVGSTLYLTPIIISGLGASGYGLWILVSQLTGYSGILDLGVRFTLTKYIAHAQIDGDRDRIRELLSTALAMGSCAGLVVLALAFVASLFFGTWFGLGGIEAEQGSRALLVVGLTTAIGFPSGAFMAALAGHHRYDLLDGLGIVSQLARTIGSLVVLDRGGGIVSIAFVNLGASLLGYVGGILCLLQRTGRLRLGPSAASWSVARSLVSASLYAFVAPAGWYLIYATDLTLIGASLSPIDVAHYGLAANVLAVVMAAVGAFTRSLVPIGSELNAREDVRGRQRVYLIATRTTLLMALPCVTALALAGPSVLSLWVGPDFGNASGRLLQVLALAYLPIIVNSSGQALALADDSRGRLVVLILGEGVTNLAISYLLIRSIGLVGVALGTLIPAVLFQGILWPSHLLARFEIDGARYWRETLRPIVLPLLLSLAAFGISTSLVGPRNGFRALLPIAALGATFYGVALFTCISRAERLAWTDRVRQVAAVVRGA